MRPAVAAASGKMAASAGIRASGSHDDIALEPELYPQQDEQPIETAEGTAY
ncbi:hypothetical protein [Roseomonas mucosa]|uniref:hypothetical protein n=1 Tax=Roseomonas mucosa TaxID=207340 RepID=UPI0030CBD614